MADFFLANDLDVLSTFISARLKMVAIKFGNFSLTTDKFKIVKTHFYFHRDTVNRDVGRSTMSG